ncbi:MAG: hypothetical protein DWQ07_07865 [Chloroflexi bacterium]|nr:MAG: hypothetical protein DWQ07_07865 [Chloroflexota bacterium]MBL1197046.1 hypothetical protein [Chloroflexota bacterium]NOH14341.1 tetratricopeptide repeat protein [Chloroflexota bacterium]
MADDRMLREAIEAAERGQRGRARDLFTRLLRSDQKNPDYWLYMSAVVESPKERVYCLQTVMRLEPNNDTAKRGLVMLGALQAEEITAVKPDSQRKWQLPEVAPPPSEVIEEQEKAEVVRKAKRARRRPRGRSALLGLVGLAVIALLAVYIFGDTGLPSFSLQPTRTLAPLQTAGPSPTFLPTSTDPNFTPAPTFDRPDTLAGFLEVPYTPTPFYVNTPHPSNEAYRAGLSALEAGAYEEAIEFFEQFLDSQPDTADVYYYIGEANLQLEDYLAAQDAFTRATLADPDFGAGYWGQARAHIGLLQFGEVLPDLNSAIENDPNLVEAYIERADYRLGRANPEFAMEDINIAENLAQNSARMYLLKAKALLLLDDDESALEAAQTSVELDVTELETYLVLGDALYRNGFIDEALEPLETYLSFDDENGLAWYVIGLAYQGREEHENALFSFDKALELNSDDLYEATYYRGLSNKIVGNSEQAFEDFENAVRVFPEWFEPALERAIMIFEEDGAERTGYLQINATSALAETDEQKAAFHYWNATALDAIGENDLAQDDWEALLELPEEAVPADWLNAAKLATGTGGAIITSSPTAGAEEEADKPETTTTPTP